MIKKDTLSPVMAKLMNSFWVLRRIDSSTVANFIVWKEILSAEEDIVSN